MTSLTEQGLDSEAVFDGKLLHVRRDTVCLPNGHTTTREYIRHPGAAVIIAVLDDGSLLLERQFRYPIDKVLIEFPAGKLDPGEAPLASAQRELQEETGYRAAKWTPLGAIHPLPAYSDEIIYIFLAEELTLGESQRDDDEFLECFTMTPDELQAAIASGEVNDAKTICALHLWLSGIRYQQSGSGVENDQNNSNPGL